MLSFHWIFFELDCDEVWSKTNIWLKVSVHKQHIPEHSSASLTLQSITDDALSVTVTPQWSLKSYSLILTVQICISKISIYVQNLHIQNASQTCVCSLVASMKLTDDQKESQ